MLPMVLFKHSRVLTRDRLAPDIDLCYTAALHTHRTGLRHDDALMLLKACFAKHGMAVRYLQCRLRVLLGCS